MSCDGLMRFDGSTETKHSTGVVSSTNNLFKITGNISWVIGAKSYKLKKHRPFLT